MNVRRFYRDVTVGAAEGGFAVLLDDRPAPTPGRGRLIVPSEALATAVAEEWRHQEKEIKSATMPLTRLAGVALDLDLSARTRFIDQLVAYLVTDLLCHRADAPAELVELQSRHWDPYLSWAWVRYGAAPAVVIGIVPSPCDPSVTARYREAIGQFGPFRLTAARALVGATGSLLLSLAAIERHAAPEAVWTAAQIDEAFQAKRWGEDVEAAAKRSELKADIFAADFFVASSPPGSRY